jgi:hypothetical protein
LSKIYRFSPYMLSPIFSDYFSSLELNSFLVYGRSSFYSLGRAGGGMVSGGGGGGEGSSGLWWGLLAMRVLIC